MKIVVYTRPDGGVTELFPSPFARLCSGFVLNGETQTLEQVCPLDILQRTFGAIEPIYAETEDEFVSRIAAKDVPAGATNVTCLDFEGLPSDPATRGAWEIVNGQVVVNTAKAIALIPVPPSISDRQFFQQLANDGIISQSEALASNAAVIPAPLLAILEAMPADQQFSAKMIVSGATIYKREDPLTVAIGTAYGWSAGQIDAFFQAAAAL